MTKEEKEKLKEFLLKNDRKMTLEQMSETLMLSETSIRKYRKEFGMPRKSVMVDLTGKSYGRLTVISHGDQMNVRCLCSCGVTGWFNRHNLARGDSRSCGCLRRELIPKILEPGKIEPRHLKLTVTIPMEIDIVSPYPLESSLTREIIRYEIQRVMRKRGETIVGDENIRLNQ